MLARRVHDGAARAIGTRPNKHVIKSLSWHAYFCTCAAAAAAAGAGKHKQLVAAAIVSTITIDRRRRRRVSKSTGAVSSLRRHAQGAAIDTRLACGAQFALCGKTCDEAHAAQYHTSFIAPPPSPPPPSLFAHCWRIL